MGTNFRVSPSFAPRAVCMSQKGKNGEIWYNWIREHNWIVYRSNPSVAFPRFTECFTHRLGAIADARSIFFLARRDRKKCEKFTWREKFHFFTFAFFTTISRFETL